MQLWGNTFLNLDIFFLNLDFFCLEKDIIAPGTNPKLSLLAGGGGGEGRSTRLFFIIRTKYDNDDYNGENVNIKLLECAIPAALSLQRSQSARS